MKINIYSTEHQLGNKERHESLDGRGVSKECQRIIARINDLYEVREDEFVRVLWRDHRSIYHNLTITAKRSLSDEEVVNLAIREYGLPGRECVLDVQHVWHRYVAYCDGDKEQKYQL